MIRDIIKRLIIEYYNKSISEDDLYRKLRKALEEEVGSKEESTNRLIDELRDYIKWNDNTGALSDYSRQQADKAVNMIERRYNSAMTANGRSLLRNVYEGIKEGLNGNLDWSETVRDSLRKLDYKEHHINTEIETNQAAVDRARMIINLLESSETGDGTDVFAQYDGLRPQRKFCKLHYGGVYSVAEILEMINSFGQPAAYYMGGYNCTHRWVPFNGKRIQLPEGTKGYIFAERGFKNSQGDELGIAKIRAKEGYKILLRKTVKFTGGKSPDAYENGELVEYKTLNASGKLPNQIANAIRYGKKQSGNIVIYLKYEKEFTGDLINVIDDAFKRRIFFDFEEEIKKVTFMLPNGKEYIKER